MANKAKISSDPVNKAQQILLGKAGTITVWLQRMKLSKMPQMLIQWVYGKKIDKLKSIISNELNLLHAKIPQQVSFCLQQIYILDLSVDMAAKGSMT